MNNRGFFLQETDTNAIWHPFALPGSQNIVIKKSKGIYLYDTANKKYIDAVSSWWVNVHGHGNTRLKNALNRQFRKTDHIIFSGFTHEPAIRLAKSLLTKTGNLYDKVFYSDNGSTAVEVALKLAIQYLGRDSKNIKIVSIEHAYHGDTFGAMSAGGKNLFNSAFEGFLFDSIQIPLPSTGNLSESLKTLENACSEGPVVFIYEPIIQGAGGMNMYDYHLLNQILAFLKTRKTVCIADEVMTGFYRTGRFLASDYVETKPDLICLSKGLTGGILPLGATLISKKIVDAFINLEPAKRFYHGHSYTGNPLACAVANESLLLFDKKTLDNIDQIAECHLEFSTLLTRNKKITNVAVCGTILRFEINAGKTGYDNSLRDRIYTYFIEKGILLRPLGNVIYVMPPYIITKKELKKIYKTIEGFLATLD
ncbi:MAG TPA: adenosylmethionine--8-amino-7-oxononanoate transaminase [Flavobacteriales bacterium]|nr:adenosylmethionine--8-amino-7-oxononanoate transaminase [Flavobacteriales bacterium]